MDPISIGLGVGGLAMQAYGMFNSMSGSRANNAAAINIANLEQSADDTRRLQFETNTRRASMEDLRRRQQMTALAENNAVTQGAQFGSGIAGGKAQIAGESNWNQEGLGLNLQFGEHMFDINKNITSERITQANAQQQMQFGAGMGSLGSSMIGSIPAMRQLTGGWNPFASSPGTPSDSGNG